MFSKDLSSSGRAKRKKWDKNNNNAIVSTNVDQNLNSRTAAQLDRLANIQIESSKQDMMINQMYSKIKEDEKQKKEELKSNIKPKKDKVERKIPVPNVPKSGLFSVENWLSKIDGGDPEKLKNKIAKKTKLNIQKVNDVVDRLSKPTSGKPKRDPDQEELKHILNKYDATERRIGGGAKKKFEYINPVPGSKKSPLISKKNVKFAASHSQTSTNDADDQDYGKY